MQRDISTTAAQGGFAGAAAPYKAAAAATSSSIPPPLLSSYRPNAVVVPPQSYSATSSLSQLLSQQYRSSGTISTLRNNNEHYQDVINRHSLCLSHLRDASEEIESLRNEISSLRSINRELNQHLSYLIQTSPQNQLGSANQTAQFHDVIDRFESLSTKGSSSSITNSTDSGESPTSATESKVEVERTSMPKSISVRSSGYLKTVLSQAGPSRTQPRTPIQVSANSAQKVFVPGVKKEEKPLELEVYNQGMYKTELCNKWQDTGTCPYGEGCQFAHGIEELRPVIRHPRYKTEVCRMVVSGVICPYGHRCHFRHALTEDERSNLPK